MLLFLGTTLTKCDIEYVSYAPVDSSTSWSLRWDAAGPLCPTGVQQQLSSPDTSFQVSNGSLTTDEDAWRFDFHLDFALPGSGGPFFAYSGSWWVALALGRGMLAGLHGNTSSRQQAHMRHAAADFAYQELANNASYSVINTVGQLEPVQLPHAANTLVQFQVSWLHAHLDPVVNCSIHLWSGTRWQDRSAFECSSVLLGHPLHFNDTRDPRSFSPADEYAWPAAGAVHLVSHLPSHAFAWREEGVVDTHMDRNHSIYAVGALTCRGHAAAPGTAAQPSLLRRTASNRFAPHHAPMLHAGVNERHNCVSVYPGGVLICMGERSDGRLGRFMDASSSLTFDNASLVQLSTAGGELAQLGQLGAKYAVPSIGSACAALSSGDVVCFGEGRAGVVRNASAPGAPPAAAASPASYGVQQLPGPAHAVSCGRCHCCAILDGGDYTCWGVLVNDGSCPGITGLYPPPPGDFATAARAFRMSAPAAVIDLSAAAVSTCLLTVNHQVFCFGISAVNSLGYGQGSHTLGDDEDPFSEGPLDMPGGLKPVKLLPALGETQCALLEDWTAVCWGLNADGQLGVGDTLTHRFDTPAEIGRVHLPRAVVDGCTGLSHTCMILHGGNVVCWGGQVSSLSDGVLGNGKTSAAKSSPVFDVEPVVPHAPAVSISCGFHTTCVTTTMGTMQCWGSLANGIAGTRLLASSAGSQAEPAQGAVWIAPRLHPSKHLPIDAVWNNLPETSSPAQRTGSFLERTLFAPYGRAVEEFQAVYLSTSGLDNTCIVNRAQRVRCWGESFNFGHGAATNSFVVGDDEDVNDHIVTLQGATAVSVGTTGSCIVTVNRNIKCWGVNFMMPYGNNLHLGDP